MTIDPRLLPTRPTGTSEYARTEWCFHDLPRGTTPEDVLDPGFWVHFADRLRVNDLIEATAADGSFDMLARVVAVDARKLWAQVRELRLWRGETVAPAGAAGRADPDGYKIEFSGPHKWRIINAADDVVAKELPSEADALAALASIKAAKPKKASA